MGQRNVCSLCEDENNKHLDNQEHLLLCSKIRENFSELEKQAQQIQPVHALPSVLKKSSAFPATHRRVFSHGQITFSSPQDTMGGTTITQSELPPNDTCSNTLNSQPYNNENCQVPKTSVPLPPTALKKGHRRGDSKTDFILPPGHEERERKRALQR